MNGELVFRPILCREDVQYEKSLLTSPVAPWLIYVSSSVVLSAWDIIAIELLILHFKGLGGGETKKVAIVLFSFFSSHTLSLLVFPMQTVQGKIAAKE